MSEDTKELALEIASIAYDKKAQNIVVMDVSARTPFVDYFIICHGFTDDHINSIAQEIMFKMKQKGAAIHHREGFASATWVLLDYGFVVAHIFTGAEREFYNLEKLWYDSPVIDFYSLKKQEEQEKLNSNPAGVE